VIERLILLDVEHALEGEILWVIDIQKAFLFLEDNAEFDFQVMFASLEDKMGVINFVFEYFSLN
jgi:hypothetical protein